MDYANSGFSGSALEVMEDASMVFDEEEKLPPASPPAAAKPSKSRMPVARSPVGKVSFDEVSAVSAQAPPSAHGKEAKIKDILIPGGKAAKLVQVEDPDSYPIAEAADKLKFNEPTPVVILVGAMTARA